MKEELLRIFGEHEQLAIWISLGVSIIIAVAGIIPSFFVTAANIYFFGFWEGTAISFAGEALGAMIAFVLYRKGFKRGVVSQLKKYPRIMPLLEARGRDAFLMIFSLRLFPFVPSGLVTFAGAVGVVSLMIFFVASSLGKVPALLIEAYSVKQVADFNWQGKIILLVVGAVMLFFVFKKLQRSGSKSVD